MRRVKHVLRDPAATSANLFIVVGAALVLVAFVDIVIVWTPVRFGTAGWEFATISRTFTNVPMTAVGWTLVAVGLIRHPGRHVFWTRGAAVALGVVALVLVGMGLIYALSLAAVVREATPDIVGALKRAVLKTGTEIAVYSTMFASASFILWRGVEARVVEKVIKKRRVEENAAPQEANI